MQTQSQRRAVLVADICDSARLQKDVVQRQLAGLESEARRHGAAETKSLGDGLVSHFDDPDGAFRAASAMQDASEVEIKIGLVYGTAGADTVNVSVRLVAMAVAGQVLTTRETVDMLSPGLRTRCRELQPLKVAGRAEDVLVYEVLWSSDAEAGVTMTLTPDMLAGQKRWALKLSYSGQTYTLEPGGSLRLGRDKTNDVVVDSELASRVHARIYERDGHFVVADQSSNGTFLRNDGHMNEIVLRRQEAMLAERGWIGLGRPTASHGDHMLRYRLERRGG